MNKIVQQGHVQQQLSAQEVVISKGEDHVAQVNAVKDNIEHTPKNEQQIHYEQTPNNEQSIRYEQTPQYSNQTPQYNQSV